MLCTWQHFRAKEELERRGARRGSDGQQGVVAPAPACGNCARLPRILGSSDILGKPFYSFTACTALISANRTFTVLKCTLCHHTFTILNQKPSTFTVPPPYGTITMGRGQGGGLSRTARGRRGGALPTHCRRRATLQIAILGIDE